MEVVTRHRLSGIRMSSDHEYGAYLHCLRCPSKTTGGLKRQYLTGFRGRNVVQNVDLHVQSKHASQGGMRQMKLGEVGFGPRGWVDSFSERSEFVRSSMANRCWGYHSLSDLERQVLITTPSIFRFQQNLSFRFEPERRVRLEKTDGSFIYDINGLFRSVNCIEESPYDNRCLDEFTCVCCANIPNNRAYQRLLANRLKSNSDEGSSTNRPIKYEFSDVMVERHVAQADQIVILKQKLATAKLSLLRAEGADVLKTLATDSRSGDLVSFINTLVAAKGDTSDAGMKDTDMIWQYMIWQDWND